MTNVQLKPCPFCGGQAIIAQNISYVSGSSIHTSRYQIGCITPMCRGAIPSARVGLNPNGEWYCSKEAAIEAWNNRIPTIRSRPICCNCRNQTDRKPRRFDNRVFSKTK
jgi:hypothetical protein